MALVRKLQTGSKAPDPNNTPKDYSQVEKALYDNLYSMSSKEARRAKPAYDQVAALVRSGAMDKALKFNPDRTYSVDTSQLPEELKKFDWTGHGDALKKDMLGLGVKVRGEDSHKEALTAAMSALRGHLETSQTSKSSETPLISGQTGITKEIQGLNNYVINKHYHDNQSGFVDDFSRLKSDDEKKAKVLSWAEENVNEYLADQDKNKNSYNYKDYENAQAFKLALGNKDIKNWDDIASKAQALGWSLNAFLPAAKTAPELEEDKKASAIKTGEEYTKQYHINPELAAQMAYKGYKPHTVTSDNPYTQSLYQKGLGFKNDEGHIVLIDKHTGGFYDFAGVDQFSPMYNKGFSWTNDLDRGLQLGNGKIAKQDFGDVGKELITSLPGAKVHGWQNGVAGDYLNKLIVEQNGHKRTLTKQSDGSYIDDRGRAVPKFNITGFGTNTNVIHDYNQYFPDIPMGISGDHVSDLNLLTSRLANKDANGNFVIERDDDLDKAASGLKWSLINDPAVKSDPELKNKILDALTTYQQALTPSKKKGGIISAKSGDKFAEYTKKFVNKPAAQQTANTTTIKDIRGTWKGQDWIDDVLDAGSTAGNIAAFIPGWGAIGAGVSFGADLVKDLRDGHIDNWGTHALNAGFIGMSAIGLGGVKSLLKVGKLAEEGYDVVKIANKASKLAAFAPEEKEALKVIKELAEAHNVTNSAGLTKKLAALAAKGGEEGELAKTSIKALENITPLVEDVRRASTPFLKSATLGSVGKSAGDVLKGISNPLNNKIVRNTARVAGMVPGIMAAPRIASTIYNDGIEYTRPEDFRALAVAGGVGSTWYNDLKAVRAIKRQATLGSIGEDKTSFNIGDDSHEIKGLVDQPKLKSTKLVIGKDKIAGINTENEKTVESFKKSLIDKLAKEGKTLTPEQTEQIMKSDLKDLNLVSTQKQSTGKYTLGDKPINVKPDRSINQRDYDLAKKYLGEPVKVPKVESEAKPASKAEVASKTASKAKKFKSVNSKFTKKQKSSLDSSYLKEGGVLKLEGGGIPDYTKLRAEKANMSNYKIPLQHLSGNYYGGVTNELIQKNWNPDILTGAFKGTSYNPTDTKLWDNKVPALLQTYIKGQPNLVAQLKNVNDTKFGQDWYSIGLDKTATPGKSKQPWEVWSDAWNKAGITITPTESSSTLQKGSNDNPAVKKFNLPLPKRESIMNALLTADALNTNKTIADNMHQGVANSMFTLPYMSSTYIRADRPHTLEADKQAAAVNSKTARMAASTADIDKGFGARLAGIAQGNAIKDKAQMADTQRLDQLRGQQLQMNANVSKYNTDILGKNRGLAANGFKQMFDINADKALADQKIRTVWGQAENKIAQMSKNDQYKKATFDILNDPKYKQLGEDYTKLADETSNDYRKAFDAEMAKPGTTQMDWNDPKNMYFKNWKIKLTGLEDQMKPLNERLKNINLAMSYGQSLKRGGKISKEARKIEADKKLFYKIVHDINKPIDKDAPDLSKSEETPLTSDKLFYDMIKKINK